MSDSYNANIYLKPSDLNNIEDRIEELTEECQERIFGKENNTYSGTNFQIETHDVLQGDLTQIDGQTSQNGTPTPESPIPVNVVSGKQVVSVLGKNLFDYKTSTFSAPQNVNITTQNNTITITTTKTTTSTNLFFLTKIPDELLENGETYTISSENVSGVVQSLQLQLRNKDGSFASGKSQANSVVYDSNYSLYIAKNIFATSGTTSIPSGTTAIIKNVQVEKGTQATTYEEYKGTDYEINLGKNLFNANDTHYARYPTSNLITIEGNNIIFETTNNANGFVWWNIPIQQKQLTISYGDLVETTTNANNRVQYLFSDTPITAYSNDIVNGTAIDKTNKYATITPTKNYLVLILRVQSLLSYTISNLQVEYGNKTTYTPYKTPIELCKIGNYQDFIRKGTGKNLFSSEMELGTIDNTTGQNVNNSNCIRSINYISVQPNTTYTLSNTMNYHILIHEYGENQNYLQYTGNFGNPKTFTTTTNTYYIRVRSAAGQVENDLNAKYQLELGSPSSSYEPYGYEGQWYIHKEINKVILNGTENWARATTATTRSSFSISTFTDRLTTSTASEFYSSNFYYRGNAQGADLGYAMSFGQNPYSRFLYVQVPTNIVAPGEIANFKTWLSTHNTDVYYILNTPTNTLIEDEELINQLNAIQLISGLNNIRVTSFNLSGIITIQSYLASFYRNIEVDDDLGGKTLYLSLPRTIHESIPNTDTSSHPLINMDGDAYIVYRYVGGYKYIGVRLPDPDNPNNHLIHYFYGYSTANQKGNPYLNHVRYVLPKNFGKVRAINKNHDIFKYIKIYDEKLIPNYEKHTWVDNEQVTMQKIDHIEKGVNNIGLYYEKPTGWVNEKEWLPTANKTYHSNYGVGVKTISYQDLNRWYNNLGLIDFDDLNEITVWNAIDDISQIEWNGESDEEWVDNFNLALYDFTTEDNNTLITENGDTMLVLVNERV